MPQNRLDPSYIRTGLALADKYDVHGIGLKQLTHEELVSALAHAIDKLLPMQCELSRLQSLMVRI